MRSRTRSRKRQRQRERPAQGELCRSSAILQLICAAIARTVIGFLKITINSLRRLATVCVRSCVCLCVSVRHAALIYVHIEQAMYINFNSTTHKKIERLEPSPAQPRSSSEQQLRLRLRQRLRLCDSLDY